MCLFYMQLMDIREDYFPWMSKDLMSEFYHTFDVKEQRGTNYLIDELIRFIGRAGRTR
jgi:hypothetical protein